jgi:dye decolorizing peroxidase
VTDAPRLSRRAVLGGTAASVGLVGLGAGAGWVANDLTAGHPGRSGWAKEAVVDFYGPHQAGITAVPPAHARYLVFDLAPELDRSGIRRALRVITEDAARLTQGEAPLADSEPELAVLPAHLTVTVGFGPELVRRVNPGAIPQWLRPLPAFSIDRLRGELSGGDLLIIVQADDPVTVSHAARVLVRQSASMVSLRWSGDGFRRARGSEPAGTTMRNLFGQVDGTAGPHPGDGSFDRVVWGDSGVPSWLSGGTGYVLRVIDMDLSTWEGVDRPDRERAVGRTLATGAPLSGQSESGAPDFSARNALGVPVIPDFAHIRRAHATGPSEVFARRGYNYEWPGTNGGMETGLLFEAFAADPVEQFLPVQRRLAEVDMMNLWTTPIGSSVFALPPGCEAGGFIGETLFA